MKPHNPHIHIHTSHEALLLAERYFEATTTEAEEEALKRYIVSPQALADSRFDEVRFVMGVAVTGQRMHRSSAIQSHPRHVSLSWLRPAIAACLVGLCAAVSLTVEDNANRCVAYIHGQETTDPVLVMQAMQHSVNQLEVMDETPSVEAQLHSMFETLDNESGTDGSLH